jgi:membrane associated rhomboid family serine protease
MLPLRDNVPSRGFPYMNITILVVNILIFVFQTRLTDESLEVFMTTFAVIPARLLTPPLFSDWPTLITAQFLHGGLLHLGSNMLALFIFGDNVEDRLGHFRFLFFYLLSGIAASVLHIWVDPFSPIPALGASGAIAGVMAGYMVLYPTARITTLVPIFIIPWLIGVPAFLWAIGWFASQVLSGVAAFDSASSTGGVGYWAHVGGFAAGFVLVWPLRRREARPAVLPVR